MARYIVLDCNGKQVGNPKGYARHSDITRAYNRKGKMFNEIWNTYHEKENKNSGLNLLYETKLIEN